MKRLFITITSFLTLAFTILPSRGNTPWVGISIDSSSLIGQSSGPFGLELLLQDGSGVGDGNNTATIGGLYFRGPQPPLFDIYLTDTTGLGQFYQLWPDTRGADLAFSTTTAVDSGSTPDQFIIKILDNTRTPIPTDGPGNALLILDIDSANLSVASFQTFGSPAFGIPAPIVSDNVPMPECGVPTVLVATLWVAGLLIWRRQVLA